MERIKNNIQLVSIHIPKTAGTTFRSIFVENVGAKNFAKLDIFNSGKVKVNDELFSKSALNSTITAVHGHCSYANLQKHFKMAENVAYITWLRNPVNRVISNYFFLKNVIAERIQEQEDENLMNRMGKTLPEFIALEENQNVMSKFLEGASLETFSFIGIQDDFENELQRLEKTLAWKTVLNRKHNVTKNKVANVGQEIVELILASNKRDVALFEKAVEINKTNI